MNLDKILKELSNTDLECIDVFSSQYGVELNRALARGNVSYEDLHSIAKHSIYSHAQRTLQKIRTKSGFLSSMDGDIRYLAYAIVENGIEHKQLSGIPFHNIHTIKDFAQEHYDPTLHQELLGKILYPE